MFGFRAGERLQLLVQICFQTLKSENEDAFSGGYGMLEAKFRS